MVVVAGAVSGGATAAVATGGAGNLVDAALYHTTADADSATAATSRAVDMGVTR